MSADGVVPGPGPRSPDRNGPVPGPQSPDGAVMGSRPPSPDPRPPSGDPRPPSGDPLLSVRDLKKHFATGKGLFGRGGKSVKAVDGVSFDVMPGGQHADKLRSDLPGGSRNEHGATGTLRHRIVAIGLWQG